ncbi:MAG: NUDIX domain-containing protein [Clostridia bacterium]|jgi:8-oxo-dGTP diphosphatase
MAIRSTAKAIIVNDGKILLNKCTDRNNGDYYSLPGGGQQKFETLGEAVVRECLEETGYAVKPIKFVALCEEICMDAGLREKYPDYAHKMYHIFLCELKSKEKKGPTEKDSMQVDSEWVELDALQDIRILPKLVGSDILGLINGTVSGFLGSEHIEFNHG